MVLPVLVLAPLLFAAVQARRPFKYELYKSRTTSVCTARSFKTTHTHRLLSESDPTSTRVETRPLVHPIGLDGPTSKTVPEEDIDVLRIFGFDEAAVRARAQAECAEIIEASVARRQAPELELIPIVQTGPETNRVNLAYFGDGYTSEERQKFIDDVTLQAAEITTNETFAPVRPLLNIWAAFTPSVESGIGYYSTPKNTVYGLYRDGTELRGVYPSKSDVAAAACDALGDKCDFPVLLGNDPYYGGLGGEFVITTSSPTSGIIVLRHEMGHNLIDVGEEYDGGQVYSGVNSDTRFNGVKWAHWLSDPTNPRAEQQRLPIIGYPWTLLTTGVTWRTSFWSPGREAGWTRTLFKFSLSGVPHGNDQMDVRVDGNPIEWTAADIGLDRFLYNIYDVGYPPGESGLDRGTHTIEFTLTAPELNGTAQLCSLSFHEYGDEAHFNASAAHIGAYPTFSSSNRTTYRPTSETCLMRQMSTPVFCSPCVEGLWLNLLSRVELIESLTLECPSSTTPNRTLNATLIELEQPGRPGVLNVTWSRVGVARPEFNGKRVVELSVEDEGLWQVNVEWITPEVRKDTNGLLKSSTAMHVFC